MAFEDVFTPIYNSLDIFSIEGNKKLLENSMENRGGDVEGLFKQKAIYIYNKELMLDIFGSEILEFEFDCYDNRGECNWLNFIIMPVYDVSKSVVGLVGYSPVNKFLNKEGEKLLKAYRQSGTAVYNKCLFLFGSDNYFERALEEGYIILTDGVFDTVSLVNKGLNAGALLGSYLSQEMLGMLKMIPRVYVAYDNDESGLMLFKMIKRSIPTACAIKQSVGKDCDDCIKSEHGGRFIEELKSYIKDGKRADFTFKARKSSFIVPSLRE